jgi:DNA replication protein DnaC
MAVEDKEREEKDRKEQERVKQAAFQKRFDDCMIGRRFKSVSFRDYKPQGDHATKVLAFCERYAETFADRLKAGDSLCMVGACGTGKNMLAAAICNKVMADGATALHTTAIKIVRKIKATWATKEDEQVAIASFSTPDLLVIDEVGVQFGTKTEQMFLTEVINDRYEAMRPTILISNLLAKDLEGYLGHRAIDRFYEGDSSVLVFDWSSYRRARA